MRSAEGRARSHHVLRAQLIWLGPGRALAPGLIEIVNGRIVALRSCRPRGLLPIAVLPGLVNAHSHLQLGALPRPVRGFLPWVQAVLETRAYEHPELWASRATMAIERFLAEGTLAVGEIDSTGISAQVLRSQPMAGRCYQEVLGYDVDEPAAQHLLSTRQQPGSRRCGAGFSPHAPYSTSDALFHAARDRGLPTAIHVAETPEEVEFVATGRGPFRDLLERLGRFRPWRAPGGTPVELLARLELLSPRSLLIHGQHLVPQDLVLLRRHRAPIVVCPGAMHYFQRTPPPVPTWIQQGLTVALGTDSLAGNEQLSMRAELERAQQYWPSLAPETLLHMATGSGGKALCRPALGRLRAGGPADFLCVDLGDTPSAASAAAVSEAFVAGVLPVSQVWIGGLRHHPALPPA